MDNNSNQKGMFRTLGFLVLFFCLFSSMQDYRSGSDSAFDMAMKKKKLSDPLDSNFVVRAALFHLGEIRLGQLAQKLSTTPKTISMGKMMEDYHTKSMKSLKSLCRKKGIEIPLKTDDDFEVQFQKLLVKSGHFFDLEYSEMIIRDHKDAMVYFEKASQECIDADIRVWASSAIPILRVHLDEARKEQGGNLDGN